VSVDKEAAEVLWRADRVQAEACRNGILDYYEKGRREIDGQRMAQVGINGWGANEIYLSDDRREVLVNFAFGD
jgi:hypothetical protein